MAGTDGASTWDKFPADMLRVRLTMLQRERKNLEDKIALLSSDVTRMTSLILEMEQELNKRKEK